MKTSERVSFVCIECAQGVSCLIRSLIGFLVVLLLCPLATEGGQKKGNKTVLIELMCVCIYTSNYFIILFCNINVSTKKSTDINICMI